MLLRILGFRSRPGLLFRLRPWFQRSWLILSSWFLPLLGLAVSSAPWAVSPPLFKRRSGPRSGRRCGNVRDFGLNVTLIAGRFQRNWGSGRPDGIVAEEISQ